MTNEPANDGRPPLDEAKAAEMVGKYVLIGLRYLAADEEIDLETLHGRIIKANAVEGFVVRLEGDRAGELYRLPPVLSPFSTAPPGPFRSPTGEIVEGADYLCTLRVRRDAEQPGA